MQLYFKHYGAGPPLVILHGLLGAGGNWHTLSSNVFGEHFSVYAVDQRNHGRSPHTDAVDYPSMAEDLRAFMDQQRLATAHVLGHSMGGKTAMQFALARPDRVGKLVVVDIAPKPYPPHHTEIFEALREIDLGAHPSRQEIDRALARRITSAPVRQFLLKNLAYDGEAQQYRWQMNLEGLYDQYESLNVGIEADRPFEGATLFVRGGKSDYVLDEDAEAIRALFPNARIATVAGAGHWVHAEQPQAFAEVVVGFLRAE